MRYIVTTEGVIGGLAATRTGLPDPETARSKHGKPVIETDSQQPAGGADMPQRSPVY
jgi:hypothetical protein